MQEEKDIVWFWRDLRLSDNLVLTAALDSGVPVLAICNFALDEEAPWREYRLSAAEGGYYGFPFPQSRA